MAAIPEPIHATVPRIYAWRESREAASEPRQYLGASEIGRPCERELWQGFRWVRRARWDGRMLRLFDTGHREEPRLKEELRAIGVTVSDVDEQGQPWAVQAHGGHFRGHLDAAVWAVPEAPGAWHVAEFKTHNRKSFDELVRQGVERAKPEHAAQMQVYMALTGMKRAVYLAVCKDDDRLHMERLHADPQAAQALLERAERIIFSAEPPPRLSADPAHWQCKGCRFWEDCHGAGAPAPTCRSCAHATPERDGTWSCARHGHRAMPAAQQRAGCASHRVIPVLLAGWAEPADADHGANWVRYRTGGERPVEFVNSDRRQPGHYSSAELHALQDKRLLCDAGLESLRAELGAEVVG